MNLKIEFVQRVEQGESVADAASTQRCKRGATGASQRAQRRVDSRIQGWWRAANGERCEP
jgi:hypothetical protein